MALFWGALAVVAITVYLCESDILVTGLLAADKQSEFVLVACMELLTLACAFGALRLFKFERVHRELFDGKAVALRKWGTIRLLLLEIPLLLDTFLYYLYMNPTFGYLAIILLLCMPFVYPNMNRCIRETET